MELSVSEEKQQNVDEIKFLLHQLSNRMPWVISKPILKKIGIHTSNGWPATIENQDIYQAESPKQKETIKKLQKIFWEHTLVGEKLVYWFSLKGIPEEAKLKFHKEIAAAHLKVEVPDSDFKKIYPFSILDKESLEKLENQGATLTSIKKIENKILFEYSSVMSYRDKIEISPERFDKADRDMLEQYESIYAILPIRKHCHDVIVYDMESEMVEVRLDAPVGISLDELSVATTNLYNSFNSTANKYFGYGLLGDHSLNLFSAINKIYKNATEGTVYELGFMAITSSSTSNNQGKLFKGKNRDLRKDDFHKGGSGAVTEIIPYRIGVQWSGSTFDGVPQLILPGNMRMLMKTPNVHMAFIRNCISFSDYDFVAKRLMSYVLTK
jgi:transcriptional regulator